MKLNLFKIKYVLVLFYFTASSVLGWEFRPVTEVEFADNPEMYQKNLDNTEIDEPLFRKFSGALVLKLNACIDYSKKTKKSEFNIMWSSGLLDVDIYSGSENYLFIFSRVGIGGGGACFVDKQNGYVIKFVDGY